MKVSRSLRDTAIRALSAREELSRNGKEPSLFEIACEIDVSERVVADALDAVSEPVSLYDRSCASGDDDGMSYIDRLQDQKSTEERWNELSVLHDSLKCLPEREQAIIRLRYFKGKTQVEISREVGISQAQVSRLEKSAIERLKRFIEA
jgi:RNA polymerase sporulation-specific sigma factor